MFHEKKVVAFIPAGGGSKGIPGKNIINVAGKPLIAHSILSANSCPLIDEVWVSSDDEKILEVSSKFGAKTIKRPNEISKDDSPSEDALVHFTESVHYDILVFIQATSPLTSSKDICSALELMIEYDSVVSLTELTQFVWDEDGPCYDLNDRKRRQDLKKTYLETGAFFITSRECFLSSKNRLSGNIGKFIMPKLRSFDIDTQDDLDLVREVIKSDIKQ